MKYEVSKEFVRELIEVFGKEQAIEELVGAYKVIVEIAVDQIEKSNYLQSLSNNFVGEK